MPLGLKTSCREVFWNLNLQKPLLEFIDIENIDYYFKIKFPKHYKPRDFPR